MGPKKSVEEKKFHQNIFFFAPNVINDVERTLMPFKFLSHLFTIIYVFSTYLAQNMKIDE